MKGIKFAKGLAYLKDTDIARLGSITFNGIGGYSPYVDVNIEYAIFMVDPEPAFDSSADHTVFQFDIDLFDNASEDEKVICTIRDCYILQNVMPPADEKGIVRNIHCKGSAVTYN